MSTYCPTALKKGNRDRLKTAQSPWAPATEQEQELEDNLALLQNDLQNTRTENSSLQAQLSAVQLDLKKTESTRQEEVARLRAQRDQA